MSHLKLDLLVRAMDDELSTEERLGFEQHLEMCEACRLQYREFGALSVRIADLVANTPVAIAQNERVHLENELRRHAEPLRAQTAIWKREGVRWGVALAAALVGVAVLIPHQSRRAVEVSRMGVAAPPPTFELDGETFVALPYSDPELPVSTSRIVQMEVPVASLAEAGVMAQPAMDISGDRSVLADVLLGADGEPRGVHVLSSM